VLLELRSWGDVVAHHYGVLEWMLFGDGRRGVRGGSRGRVVYSAYIHKIY
jgi:hypothetical protein